MTTQFTKDKNVIRVDFKEVYNNLYRNLHFEIRLAGTQIRFYEVNEKNEYNLPKDTVRWLMKNSRLPRLKILKGALKGDKSIFNKMKYILSYFSKIYKQENKNKR